MDLHVDESLDNRIARQRAARLARDAALPTKQQRKTQRILRGGRAQEFWDLVDTSGGADACHRWKGAIDTTWATYIVGKFQLAGLATTLAHRIACFLTFGKEVPRDYDIIPDCEEHLCCNVRHLLVARHGISNKMASAERVEKFFCPATP